MRLAEAQSSIATLTSTLAKTGTKTNRSNATPTRYNEKLEKDGYCCSHELKNQKDTTVATAKIKKSGHMTAATRSDTMGGKLYNKGWYQWRRVCDNLDDKHINIIETTNTITHKHVENLAAVDTGTSGHFLKSNSPCVNRIIATNPLGIRRPEGNVIYYSHTALLHKYTLPIEAQHSHIFPDLKNKALLSIGMFCDNGCIAIFWQ